MESIMYRSRQQWASCAPADTAEPAELHRLYREAQADIAALFAVLDKATSVASQLEFAIFAYDIACTTGGSDEQRALAARKDLYAMRQQAAHVIDGMDYILTGEWPEDRNQHPQRGLARR
ncbi:hypothetical protein N8I74_15810 [Chitiniphilus purpureus]|uniref:Uncharacterized protein n=1 Tax=Chitiniphilus purpureus TaxID=2981137 RepID=A0ABY6DKA0_9NEIS|nr:hypothetical protein [Chitiniphilus sp. CD1]UXY14769.1 hypothetical protein N8I74_15810 [Chitiniphilus sp. CD1]